VPPDPSLNAYWTLLNLGVTGIFLVLLLIGKVRAEREVTREREVSDAQGLALNAIIGELRAQTVTLNRMADGIEERNRIERTLRGRRT
jgi:hypothetical protein